MNGDAELDAAIYRHARVPFNHSALNLDRAANGVDHAAEFDESAVPGALDDAAMMRVDGGIDQVAPQAAEPRQSAILVGPGEAAIADDVRDQDRCDFPRSRHGAPSRARQRSTKTNKSRAHLGERNIRSSSP